MTKHKIQPNIFEKGGLHKVTNCWMCNCKITHIGYTIIVKNNKPRALCFGCKDVI